MCGIQNRSGYFRPRPNCSAFAQPEVPEPEVARQWREDQAEKIAQRDEESKRKRQETIARAEKEIDKL
ncbi:hypothetical protein RSOLAG1IB_11581 [Rhizoctonia solani AG-1 IB]|uniref:Clathrin light chain n=1 Tax=Thanatephorus cucumeris (strain AG1-IB / isolate 7/3/14) TaxID=1108050 RepID=A0A0B7FDC9_THACB|nr:hypothetical protein RSOLAG1IB_11581 [Rhizoctonia solani AG-1 IB]